VPAVPSWVLEPLWQQFAALLPTHRTAHPLGCHRPRISDRVVFDKLLQILVFGCAYERIADEACSARTLRRRRDEWIAAGVMEQLHQLALSTYDRRLGLELDDLSVDGCITKAPCAGEVAGPNPVDRGKQGGKRSLITDAHGIPLGVVAAGANVRDDHLLPATLATLDPLGPLPEQPTVHLDRGYDYQPVRDELTQRGLAAEIARRGLPAPIQVGHRWVVERSHAWLNAFGKLRWCTERRRLCVEFYLALACVIVIVRRLVRRIWTHYRWDTRPRRRP
jgi:transposase